MLAAMVGRQADALTGRGDGKSYDGTAVPLRMALQEIPRMGLPSKAAKRLQRAAMQAFFQNSGCFSQPSAQAAGEPTAAAENWVLRDYEEALLSANDAAGEKVSAEYLRRALISIGKVDLAARFSRLSTARRLVAHPRPLACEIADAVLQVEWRTLRSQELGHSSKGDSTAADSGDGEGVSEGCEQDCMSMSCSSSSCGSCQIKEFAVEGQSISSASHSNEPYEQVQGCFYEDSCWTWRRPWRCRPNKTSNTKTRSAGPLTRASCTRATPPGPFERAGN